MASGSSSSQASPDWPARPGYGHWSTSAWRSSSVAVVKRLGMTPFAVVPGPMIRYRKTA
jgi:hypothetical protein